VLVQIAAVRGALDRARMILDEHLTECIARAAEEGNIDVEIKELKAALDRFCLAYSLRGRAGIAHRYGTPEAIASIPGLE